MRTIQQKIQREFNIFVSDKRIKHFLVDCYSDRLNFVGVMFLRNFFESRGVITNIDRAGFSISIDDAKKLNLPVSVGTYYVYRDARKKWDRHE